MGQRITTWNGAQETQGSCSPSLPSSFPHAGPSCVPGCLVLATALRVQTVLSHHGSEYPRAEGQRCGLGGMGRLDEVGSLDENGEEILDLSCGHTWPWPVRSTVLVWRRRLAQSGRAVVSRRDVELAPRSRVKMLDVAIRVTATYPAKWLLAPVEGRHTSSPQ